MIGTGVIGLAAGGGLTVGGVGLLRRAWRRERPALRTFAGWGLLALAALAWAAFGAADKAMALALLLPSLAGLGFVLANMEVRAPRRQKARCVATELPDHSSEAVWRGVARFLCAGPLSGLSAALFAAAWAFRGPGSEAARLGVALLLAPCLWAGGVIWATTDEKLARIVIGLSALALLGGAAAIR